jgi:hypothetical protein
MSLFTKIQQHINQRHDKVINGGEAELLFAEPNVQQAEEITQSNVKLELIEQLEIIHIVKDYLNEFTIHRVELLPSWVKGYAMLSDMFVASGDQILMRCNVEAFYQDPNTGLRELVYLVSLVRFDNDRWCVFQVKEAFCRGME